MESAHPSDDEVAEGEAKRGIARGAGGGSDGGGGRPRVLPAPITEAIMPVRTRLQESGAEVAVYYSQIEGQVTKMVGVFIRPQPPPPPPMFPRICTPGRFKSFPPAAYLRPRNFRDVWPHFVPTPRPPPLTPCSHPRPYSLLLVKRLCAIQAP